MEFLKDRKAVSPAIVTILTVIIAISASFITYLWTINFVKSTIAKAEHQILIQSVEFSNEDGNKTVRLYIQNVGKGKVNIVSVFINGTLYAGNVSTDGEYTALPYALDEGKTCCINVKFEWVAGQQYKFKVVCADGTLNEKTLTAK